MNTTLLNRILDDARHNATGSDAMSIEDLQRDLALTPDDVAEMVEKAGWFDEIKAHVAVQPFDILSENHVEDPNDTLISSVEVGGFQEWFNELERLAQ